MIDLSESVAKKTVQFGRPITGQELMDAVQAACASSAGRATIYSDRETPSFYHEARYDDGYQFVVGRTGQYVHENLLVTPDKTSAYIEPDKTYTSAVVVRHDQSARGPQLPSDPDVDVEIQSVVQFSDDLARAVGQVNDAGADLSRDPHAPAMGAASSPQLGADGAKNWGHQGVAGPAQPQPGRSW